MKTLFILTVIYLARSVVSMEGEAPPSASEERKLIRNPENGQLFYLGNFGAGGSKTCDRNCKDKMQYCHLPVFAKMCTTKMGLFFSLKCPKTCGLCTPCNYNAGACSETCEDAQPKKCQIFAPTYCEHSQWRNTVQKYCEKSCGVCIKCGDLKPVPDCSDDCVDEDSQCRGWAKEKNYCGPESPYRQWMFNNCKQSCGVCRHCDGEAPPGATRRPTRPTRPTYPTRDPSYPTTRRPYTTPNRHNDYMCHKKLLRAGDRDGEKCLAAHNYYRCLHGVEDLEYDRKLEDSAQLYAETYPIRPSEVGVDRDDGVGENWVVLKDRDEDITDAVAKWYAQGLGYDYQQQYLVHRETMKFTQLIWSDTVKVGCGIAEYRSKQYVVAHYYEEGNQEDYAFQNIFEPILDVCNADCDVGICHGNDNTHDCECTRDRFSRDRDTVPECSGNCVVKCPEPRFNEDEWVESCQGERHCTCITSGSRVLGAKCS